MFRTRRSGRRLATALTSTGLAALIASGSVLAGTPVSVGYRDHAYGGGATRPSGDKPQSKLWYTADGTWWAGMFLYTVSPAKSENRIWKLSADKVTWTVQSTVVDTRDRSHADYLWDEANDTLYVVSVPLIPNTQPTVATDDGIKVFKYTYSAGTYTPVVGFPVTIQNTASVPNVSMGGAPTVTIALDSTGDLWAAWPRDGQVRYSKSDDGGATWADPAQLPAQAANPIKFGVDNESHDSTAVIAFGAGKVGVMWSDHDNIPGNVENGYYFATIDAGADPAVAGNWALQDLPPVGGISPDDGEVADNHINLKTTSDGSVYMVGKTGKDTALCATNKAQALTGFYARTPAGTWSAHLLGTVGDCNTRPQLVISEELDTAYVFITAPNGGGTVYRKSAPLSGADAFDFRGAADQTLQPGTPFIQSTTETQIDDPSTTKQVVTAASDIVVIGDNITSTRKYFMHNFMTLPATDTTDPIGTISINAGAAATTSTAVSVAVPATDTGGSGVSLVRLANSGGTSGGVLNGAGATSFVHTTPLDWTLTAGDGTKTVYAQWRDSTGNWSLPVSDTIAFDTTAPTGSITINGGAATTTTASVTLGLTTDDGGGSGTTSVLISNTSDFTGVSPTAYAASIPWALTPGNEMKTVYVKFRDAAGNTSAAPATDDIQLVCGDTTAPTVPGIPSHTIFGSGRYGIPVRFTWTAGTDAGSGVAGYVLQRSIDGGAYTTVANPPTNGQSLDLSNSGHDYRFRVATRDNCGNVSSYRTGPTFRARSFSESNASVKYLKTWSLSTSTVYVGGKARVATTNGASATLTFSGNRVGWLSRLGPTSGYARVYIDGVLVKTVNLYSATVFDRKLAFVKTWSAIGTHTIRIVALGTSGHPRVTLDQIFVLR